MVAPSAVPELIPNTSPNLWFAYAKTADEWVIAELSDTGLVELDNGLTNPPVSILEETAPTVRYWLQLSKADGEEYVASTDVLTPFVSQQSAITPLVIPDGPAAGAPWGILTQESQAAEFHVCQLPPASDCWTTQSNLLHFWSGMDSDGAAYSFRVEGDQVVLWRNLDAPLIPSLNQLKKDGP